MKHKHAELIHAWADGAIIQCKDMADIWIDMDWIMPNWNSNECEFRIKPEPKPDEVCFTRTIWNLIDTPTRMRRLDSNLMLTFDGETGELKSAEVIK